MQKILSCQLCQQRKVKCDKIQPTCSYCVRHKADCHYIPSEPRSKKRKRGYEDQLRQRLQRYEQLLRAHGINNDEDTSDDNSMSAIPTTQTSGETSPLVNSKSSLDSQRERGTRQPSSNPSGRFVIDGGKRRFVENGLWQTISEGLLQGPKDMMRLTQPKSNALYENSQCAHSEAAASAGTDSASLDCSSRSCRANLDTRRHDSWWFGSAVS